MSNVEKAGLPPIQALPKQANLQAASFEPIRDALSDALGDALSDALYASLRDPSFSADLIAWQKQHGRHHLPWQNTQDAYRVWLSEIMLQQTQVAAVIPYYQRFLQRFPDVFSLASAPQEDVMAHWSGLGYYTRARNLHRCAQQVVSTYAGQFPADPVLLAELPGIGRSTAAAIAAFSYGVRAAILDGNVKRVFARVFAVETYPGEKKTEDALWRRAQALLPEDGIAAYTQGLMDLGASLCSRNKPTCTACPMQTRCMAFQQGRVAELPVRKPKRAVPEKYTDLLLFIVQGQVLLETRPALGIWGGLMSLPELDGQHSDPQARQRAEILAQAKLKYAKASEIMACEALASFSHTFTHFKLQIRPWLISLSEKPLQVAQAGQTWMALEQMADAGLPAPVKKLLLALPEVLNSQKRLDVFA